MRNKAFKQRNVPKYFHILISLCLIFLSSLTLAVDITKVYTVEEWEKLRKQEYLNADLVIVGQALSCTTRLIETHDRVWEDSWVSHYTTYIDDYQIKIFFTLKGTISDSILNAQSDSYTQSTTSPPILEIDEKHDTMVHTSGIMQYPLDGQPQPNRITIHDTWIILLQKKDTSYVLTYFTGNTKDELDFYQSFAKKDVPETVTNKQLNDSILLSSITEEKFIDWIKFWQKKISGFNLQSLKKVEENTIEPIGKITPYIPDTIIEKSRKRYYIYSPDSTKFLDIYLGMQLYEENGEIKEGWNIDRGAALIDLKDKTFKRLLNGTYFGFNGAIWFDNNTFVIYGWTETSNMNYVAFLRIYKLSKNRLTIYYGPEVKGPLFH